MREIKLEDFLKLLQKWMVNGDLIRLRWKYLYIMEQTIGLGDIYSGIEVHKESIGQYTGLKDKDGKKSMKEIYYYRVGVIYLKII